METYIDEKYLRTICLSELQSYQQVFDGKSQWKVLRVTSCGTSSEVEKLWYRQDFRSFVESDKFCFAIVLEVDDDLRNLKVQDFLEKSFETSKPMLISFESTINIECNEILFKEANENRFKRIQSDAVESDEMDLGTLLQNLRCNVDGSFDGKLLSASVGEQKILCFLERAVITNNILCIRFLRLFEFDLGKVCAENKNILELAAKSCDFQGFLALLDLPFDCDLISFIQAIDSLEVLQPQNTENFNLLMIASESGNAEAVNFLLKCSYDINEQQNLNDTAASLAWEKENYEIFVKLLQENSLFPKDFHQKLKRHKARGKVRNVLTFINDLKSLHEAIKRGRIDRVKDFLANNPTARHAYNTNNESAAATALKAEQFGIYEMLISQGICLGPHEDIAAILSQHQQMNCRDGRRLMMKKMYIHEMHKKYFKEPMSKHLMTLLSHSDVGFDVPDTEKRFYFKFIKEAFEVLDEIAEVVPILKLVARSKFIRVIFDFNRDSVSHLDATTCNKTKGTSYFKSGYIYVGAKGLLDEEKKFEVLGTLAHELTHYAMQLVYENNCRPYNEQNQTRLEEFQTIGYLCEFNKDEEPKMFYVFNYPETQQHAELIVRVPHLLVLYKTNDEVRLRCERIFGELFEFFRTKTLIDLENELPLMQAKREIAEMNSWMNVIQPLLESSITLKAELLDIQLNASCEVLLILTNCVKLTVKAIHQQLERDLKSKVQNFFLFARPTSIESENSKSLLAKALNLCTKPTVVFECDDDAPLDQLVAVVNALKATERVIFVTKNLRDDRFTDVKFRVVHVKHKWEDFIPSTKTELWKFKVNFQGELFDLCDLMKFPSKAVDHIPFCDLLGRRLKISHPLKFSDIDFYVERKFIAEGGEELNFDALSEVSKSSKVVLISDDPGAGKTTTFKTLSEQLKKKFPLCWVGYVDLKQFVDVYSEVKCKGNIATFFGEELFSLDGFELELFMQLYTDNRLILLLDGIDEICPNYKSFILTLLLSVKSSTMNQLWMSTRPHLALELSRELGVPVFHLKPFNKREQRKFYFEFYEHRGIPLDEIGRYVAGIEKLMSFLSKNRLFWSTITSDISSNPLFMRIAASIYNDDIMQSSKAGKCHTLCNLYLMYERFIEKKFSVWMHKGRLSFTDQIEIHRGSESIMRAHLRLALERTFDRKAASLIEESTLTEDKIIRVGLITHDGSDLQFVHRTFGEFFVADFLFKKIFCQERFPSQKPRGRKQKRVVMQLFVRVLSSDEFQMIRAFLGNAIELVKHEKDMKRFARLAFLFKRSSKRVERDKMLSVAVGDGCVNLTTLIVELQAASQCVLIKMMKIESRNLENVLLNSLKTHRGHFDTIKTLWDAAKSVYDPKTIKKLLLEVHLDGKKLLLSLAASDCHETLSFLLAETKLYCNEQEFRDLLTCKDENEENALEIALKFNKNEGSVRAIWSFFNDSFGKSQNQEILRGIITNPFAILNKILANDVKVFREFWIILQESLAESELKEVLMSTNEDGLTALHLAKLWNSEFLMEECIKLLADSNFSFEELQTF